MGAALQLAVVAEIPSPVQGETTERPTPTPKATTIRETAAVVNPPARMAPHETVELKLYGSMAISGVRVALGKAPKSAFVPPRRQMLTDRDRSKLFNVEQSE